MTLRVRSKCKGNCECNSKFNSNSRSLRDDNTKQCNGKNDCGGPSLRSG